MKKDEKVSLTGLRKELQYLLDRVHFTGRELVVYKGKKPWVSIRQISDTEKTENTKK